MAIQVGVRIW